MRPIDVAFESKCNVTILNAKHFERSTIPSRIYSFRCPDGKQRRLLTRIEWFINAFFARCTNLFPPGFMSSSPMSPSASHVTATPQPSRRWRWQRLGFNFLALSILLHLVFGLVTAHFVVQTIQAKRKQTFAAAPRLPSAPTHTVEHKVQMRKQRQTSSAPAPSKRITTTSNATVALPVLPVMPQLNKAVVPVAMAGIGGTGLSLNFGTGGSGSSGGGSALNLFGLRTSGQGLVGHLYDLKQDRNHRPTNMTVDRYATVVTNFARGGFNMGVLANYFQASAALYTTQMFTPAIDANLAPKSFGVDAEVQPRLWVAVYKGRATPLESGTYHFVGIGDDVLVVRFNGKVVLDHGYLNTSGLKAAKAYHYKFDGGTWYDDKIHNGGHGVGLPIEVIAGTPYDMQVLIGEQPGGQSMFQLLIEKDGVEYQKDADGNPILPVFRLAKSELPAATESAYPPHMEDGPIWRSVPPVAEATSIFDH